jgi:hypothetical protein
MVADELHLCMHIPPARLKVSSTWVILSTFTRWFQRDLLSFVDAFMADSLSMQGRVEVSVFLTLSLRLQYDPSYVESKT